MSVRFNESVIGRVASSPSETPCRHRHTLQQGSLLCDEVMFVYVCVNMCVSVSVYNVWVAVGFVFYEIILIDPT